MSPYLTTPPPVYAKNWANVHNLVESTKIERQVVSSKKVHRKEKKDKKKEKKVKKNEKCIEKLYFPIKKQTTDESEQLEKSCLTEEHDQRHHVGGYLSDGSQNSKKRRRETSPAVESNIKATPVAGNPLRIRFVFKKPKEVEAVVPEEDRVCSTSGTERPIEISSSVSVPKPTSVHGDNSLSTSIESEKISIPCDSKRRKKHKTSKESRFNTLFDEWVPPCISLEEDNSNNSDDWLFGTRREGKAASNKASIKNDEDMIIPSMVAGDSSFPRAQLLPEVGIFSLPYTVPF